MFPPRILWIAWIALALAMTAAFAHRFRSPDRRLFLPGETSHGHYQIELACNACHTPLMGVKEDACIKCHADELRAANDSHPKSKFTDPRNADLLKSINAANCVTCHREHMPERALAMGVTLPGDYCVHCHQSTLEERPSHRGLPFDSCSTAGCHNYHDNTALYEDFLARGLGQPDLLPDPKVPARAPGVAGGASPLTVPDHDAPKDAAPDPGILRDWAATAHARAGVNCGDCHAPRAAGSGGPASWSDAVPQSTCARCHENASEGFLAGRHGMRLAQDLPPMSPALARLPMRPESAHSELTCVSCHGAHDFDTRRAAVDACLSCHADSHSLAYKASPHFQLWQAELDGHAVEGSGVSCATCHMPRETVRADGGERVRVEHNQNLNLRPNEKMVRSVCLNCHGLGFTLDSLADAALIQTNFAGRPAIHVESLDWVARRRPAENTTRNPHRN